MAKVMILIGVLMYLLILGASKCERRDTMERNCNNCIRCTPDKGCTAWDCDYIPRREAIEAYKEKMAKEQKDG